MTIPDVPGVKQERLLRLAQQLGKDGYAYAGAVNNLIKKMFDAGGWDNLSPNAINDTMFPQPGETGSAAEAGLEAPMGTNPLTCEISSQPLSEYIRTYGGETAGSVIYSANMAHEQFHRNTCQAQIRQSGGRGYDMYMRDPANYRQDELGAYRAGIDRARNWYNANCR
ncbi:hypothetical protein [Baaleninema simplex]|uniref:hypothetical protein n=1 Tax=Baaleninema simplex TaxID=2862350 RepID=UPI00034B186E|nr:hypothetical protein [Baaleninema simplex]